MRIKRRMKRSTKQYIMVAFICISVIGGAALFTSIVITSQIREDYQSLLKEAYFEMEINQRNVYVATENITSGEEITEDKLKKKKVFSSQPQETYITKGQMGKLALVDIPSGTQVLNSMITEQMISSELREVEYEVIHMNTNIIEDDTVDVRIFFPNGESYIILSKKVIKGLSQATVTAFLWLDEEELLRMSAAIVDAALYPGSKLYVTKYIEPNIQEASAITYTPSLSILSLIEKDPNIVTRCSQELYKEVRKKLENRLALSTKIDVANISWDICPNNSFGNEAVLSPENRVTNIDMEDNVPTDQKGTSVTAELGQNDTSVTDKSGQYGTRESEDSDLGDMSEDSKSLELGKNASGESGYLFYSEEAEAMKGDVEFGE